MAGFSATRVNDDQPMVFDGAKYLNLETYRTSGVGVRTPVWFATAPAEGSGTSVLYVNRTADSGKAKRIRRSPVVRIAACDVRGKVTGPWRDAHAEIVGVTEFAHGMRLIDRKYWPWKQILDLATKLSPRHRRVMLAIRLT